MPLVPILLVPMNVVVTTVTSVMVLIAQTLMNVPSMVLLQPTLVLRMASLALMTVMPMPHVPTLTVTIHVLATLVTVAMDSIAKTLMNVLIADSEMHLKIIAMTTLVVPILMVHMNAVVTMVTSETELIAKTQMRVELILLKLLVLLLMVSGIPLTAIPMLTVLTTSDLSIVPVMMGTLVTEHSVKMSTNVMMLH